MLADSIIVVRIVVEINSVQRSVAAMWTDKTC